MTASSRSSNICYERASERGTISNDDLTYEDFDSRGFDVPDLKAVTLASSSDGDQSKQPGIEHEDAPKNRRRSKKEPKSNARSKKRASTGKTSESFDDYEDYKERGVVNKASKRVSEDRPGLFAPTTLREVTACNRIWLPSVCAYSSFARDGRSTPFHYQRYVSRAPSGFGMVIVESTVVAPEGRIIPCDLGLWGDGQIDAWRWIMDGIREADVVPVIQLSHAGHRASTGCLAVGCDDQSVLERAGGWPTMAPSEIAFGGLCTPRALSVDEIHGLVGVLTVMADRAVAAGFQTTQVHAVHGYLISQFLDPLNNERDDEYGGDLAGRSRFLVEVVDAVRGAAPEGVPALMRISAMDWAAGGRDLDQIITLSRVLKEYGVDVMDVSTGGIMPRMSIPVKSDCRVPFSEQARAKADIPVTAVSLITKPKQTAKTLAYGGADAAEIGHAALRDPYWSLCVANKLGIPPIETLYVPQYVAGTY